MVDTIGADHGVTAIDRNTPAIFPQWDTKSVWTFAKWEIMLRTDIDLRTFDGFIDLSRPSLEEEESHTTRMGAEDRTIRLADIKVAIDLWDKYDRLLFTTLLNSTILSER